MCVPRWTAPQPKCNVSVTILKVHSQTSLLNLWCSMGNFSKIWSECGEHESEYRGKRGNKYTHNYMYNTTFIFLHIIGNNNTDYWDQENFVMNMQFTTLDRVLCSSHIFTKLISKAMYVSINKQLISFQNCFSIISVFLGKGLKDVFFISNVPAGKITLLRGWHFANKLWVQQPKSNITYVPVILKCRVCVF